MQLLNQPTGRGWQRAHPREGELCIPVSPSAQSQPLLFPPRAQKHQERPRIFPDVPNSTTRDAPLPRAGRPPLRALFDHSGCQESHSHSHCRGPWAAPALALAGYRDASQGQAAGCRNAARPGTNPAGPGVTSQGLLGWGQRVVQPLPPSTALGRTQPAQAARGGGGGGGGEAGSHPGEAAGSL